jgi:hypothetical protein
VSLGGNATAILPAPQAHWFEQPFGGVGLDQFAVDLRRPVPPSVRQWLDAPLTTRGLAHAGPGSHMTGGTLAQWFDVIVHRQVITPTRPVSPSR